MMMDGGAGDSKNREEKWSDAGGGKEQQIQRGWCRFVCRRADGGTLTDVLISANAHTL